MCSNIGYIVCTICWFIILLQPGSSSAETASRLSFLLATVGHLVQVTLLAILVSEGSQCLMRPWRSSNGSDNLENTADLIKGCRIVGCGALVILLFTQSVRLQEEIIVIFSQFFGNARSEQDSELFGFVYGVTIWVVFLIIILMHFWLVVLAFMMTANLIIMIQTPARDISYFRVIASQVDQIQLYESNLQHLLTERLRPNEMHLIRQQSACTTTDCSICLGELKQSEKVVQLSCHDEHIFHYECLRNFIMAKASQVN